MLKWFKKIVQGEDTESSESSAGVETAEAGKPPKSLFARLRERLGKTHHLLVDGLRNAIGLKAKVDENLLEQIEEILIQGDVGTRSAERIIEQIRREGRELETIDAERVLALVKTEITDILKVDQKPIDLDRKAPTVILVVGVNGTGKTTTIGKLALHITNEGKSVMLVAADTFRAGAVDQLEIWAKRTGAAFVRKDDGADPASVCYEALSAIKNDPPDVVLIDTAGRLHTKTYLMNELSKVIRIIKKIYPEAPHETILVLDATTGQNALSQVKTFREVADITGLIMTKLDGTAKGGILVALKEAHHLPIYKIGIGEAVEDLRDFKPDEFAEALFAPIGDDPFQSAAQVKAEGAKKS